MSWRLDPHSRFHLRKFAGQVALLVLCCAPTLLIDKNAPVLFLSLLGLACRITALALLIVAFFFKERARGLGFGPLDHCLGFTLLQLGCSIALHFVK